MTDTYRSGRYCGDHAALVGYLYDDCEPGEREAIAAHVQGCRACADELEALGGARRQLAAWTPPDTVLGFRIAPASQESSSVIPFASAARTGWWRQPLPAWAQLAAAVAIFASGLAIGTSRGAAAPAPAVEPAAQEVRATLTTLERRLAGVEQIAHVVRTQPERVAGLDAVTNEAAIFQRIRREMDSRDASSEERWKREMALRILDLAESQTRQAEQIETNVQNRVNQVETNVATVFQRVAFQR